MRRDSVSTLVSLLILGVVAYMFRGQLSSIFSGLKVGGSTKGASPASPTAPGVAFYPIAPGQTEVGTVNSTGGFTAAPDPNGIGGGFAT
jgi:hypothetical protein